jgi:hypothetical protein
MAGQPGGSGPRTSPTNDIYTVLVGIGAFAVIATLAFVIYRCNELLGKPFPSF